MKARTLEEITNPLVNPAGEIIYELFGRPENLGGTTHHSLAYVVLPYGKSSAAHFHKISEETYIITKGEGELIIDKEKIKLKQGDSYLIKPGKIHQIFNRKKKQLEFFVISAPAFDISDSYFV